MKKPLLIIIAVLLISTVFTPSFAYGDQVHRVLPGDTLYGVAGKYETTVTALIKNNPFLKNPDRLFANQVLVIPEINQGETYQVQPGDSLYTISKKLEIPMKTLASYNKLNNWNMLYTSQVLSVPSNRANSYIVKPGDTLYLISQNLDVSMAALSQENNLEKPDYLYVGQVLTIPNATTESKTSSFEALVGPLAERYPDTFYLKGATNSRRIALTFDDGPDEIYTPQILDILKAHNAKATFFLIGSKVNQHPDIVNRIINEGHTIGNHTWTHPDLRKITSEQLTEEIHQTEIAIKNVSGLTTAIMRPPYGAVNDSVVSQLREMDYKVIDWNVDSVDWSGQTTADEILINTLSQVTRDAIVLMHDSPGDRSATVKALSELIETLKKNDYSFVTADEMLGIQAYK